MMAEPAASLTDYRLHLPHKGCEAVKGASLLVLSGDLGLNKIVQVGKSALRVQLLIGIHQPLEKANGFQIEEKENR